MATIQDYLRREEINTLFLQGVTHPTFDAFRSYKTYKCEDGMAGYRVGYKGRDKDHKRHKATNWP